MQAAKPSPSLIALKPRQVLLSSNPTMKIKASAAQSLNPDQHSLLLLSIAHFLQRKSFSKTLKKFLSEAQIQQNDLTGSSLDLEEMCCKYLAMSDHSSSNLNREQFHDITVDGNPNSDGQVDIGSTAEIATKRKKKRGNDSKDTIACQSEVDDKSANSKKIEEQVFQEAAKASGTDVMGGLQLNESAKKEKEKKKKKMKLDSESRADSECYALESLGGESEKKSKHALSTESNRVSDVAIEDKTKDKKKKKNKPTSDSFVENVDQHGSEDRPTAGATLNASDISLEDKNCKSKKRKKKDDSEDLEKEKSTKTKDNKNWISEVDSTITDSKGSKKRKRLDSEVLDSERVDKNAIEDSKRRKTESPEEQINSLVGADQCVGKENKGEIDETVVDVFLNKPAKQLHEQENGNIEKNGKNSEQKSLKKQSGSVEPKKPFQRVNVDEVVFVDKRLKDNSYWAKDGADDGYGAKAQEVLGQVRGRDFRHEKTKKKRGSYRGGQIDLQSHSIKFNYSDDE